MNVFSTIGRMLGWIFFYFVGFFLMIGSPYILLLYTFIYSVAMIMIDPKIAKRQAEKNKPDDCPVKENPLSESRKSAIRAMLEYYNEYEVATWCMATYRWDRQQATNLVRTVNTENARHHTPTDKGAINSSGAIEDRSGTKDTVETPDNI